MFAISVRQPWAWAIIHAGKDVENRTWRTTHRGDLLIHASMKFDLEGVKWIKRRFGIVVPKEELDFGAVIGVVNLVDVRPVHELRSRWKMGTEYGWMLDKPRAITPVRYSGRQQLFAIPTEAIPELRQRRPRGDRDTSRQPAHQPTFP